MIKLSIIVPIYGVERYLHKCIDSLLVQELSSTDYEVILVDDESSDACPQICDEYASNYENIRVIHRKNGGLSVARNSGIEIANGEYLMFVDSDDYLQPKVIGNLIKQIEEEQLDVLRYNYQNVNEYGDIIHPNKDPKRDVNYSEVVVDGDTFLNERLGPACYAWQFVIKRELLEGCLFKVGIYFEDTEWTPRMLMKAKRVASTKRVVYNYLWRTGSITLPTDPIRRKKVIEDKILLIHGFKEKQKLVKNSVWFTWMTSFITMSILGMLVELTSDERKKYINELRSQRIFPLSTCRTNRNEKIKILIANMSPSLYCTLMSFRKRE